jgi:dephospho-CoA kinase
MLLVGLTGNYGMGKSAVLSMFEKLGAEVLDADTIVASLITEKGVLEKIKGLLGDNVLHENGSLNKKLVADIVFKNDALRHALEDIIHPLVFDRINLLLKKLSSKGKIIIVEIPLLYERGYEDRFDRTITIYATEKTALNRLSKVGVGREEATLRLRAQIPIKEKIKRSDFAIDNNGTIEETQAQAEKIYGELYRGRAWK